MYLKLVAVVALIGLSLPALAQVRQQTDDELRPPTRGQAEELEPSPRLEDRNVPIRYEGVVTFSGNNMGKCSPRGHARATVTGNRFDATLTFPISFQVIRGQVSGSRVQGSGEFGYTLDGSITEERITGFARKLNPSRRVVQQPTYIPGFIPVPGLPKETTIKEPDCTYSVNLQRVSPLGGGATGSGQAR